MTIPNNPTIISILEEKEFIRVVIRNPERTRLVNIEGLNFGGLKIPGMKQNKLKTILSKIQNFDIPYKSLRKIKAPNAVESLKNFDHGHVLLPLIPFFTSFLFQFFVIYKIIFHLIF